MWSSQLASARFGLYFIFTIFLVQNLGLLEKILRGPLQSWGSPLDSEGLQGYHRVYQVARGSTGISWRELSWGFHSGFWVSSIVTGLWLSILLCCPCGALVWRFLDPHVPFLKGVCITFKALWLGIHCASAQFSQDCSTFLTFPWQLMFLWVTLFWDYLLSYGLPCCWLLSSSCVKEVRLR